MLIMNKWKIRWVNCGCAVIASILALGFLGVVGFFFLLALFGPGIEYGYGRVSNKIGTYADRTPQWSADGRTLVVNLVANYRDEIYGATIDGNGLWRIAHTESESSNANGVFAPSLSATGEVAYLEYYYSEGLFDRSDPDKYHIELTDIDGAEHNRLFSKTGTNGYPTWSPDGSRLAFATNGQQMTIMTKRELGLSSRLLSILTFWRKDDARRKYDTLSIPRNGVENPSDGRPVWSNDGQRLAYVTSFISDDGFFRVSRIVNTRWDGADEKIVMEEKIPVDEVRAILFEPTSLAWSPADARIYFVYYELAYREWEGLRYAPSVRSARPDGSDERIVAPWWDDFLVKGLKLSPDGSQLLFTSYRSSKDDDDEGLFVMKTDGSGVIKIFYPSSLGSSGAGSRTVYASWSPDGSRIAVHELRDIAGAGRGSVYTIAPDGTDARSLIRLNRDGKPWPGRDEPLPHTPTPLTP